MIAGLIFVALWIALVAALAVRNGRILFDRPSFYGKTAAGEVSECRITEWDDDGDRSYELVVYVNYQVKDVHYSTSRYRFYSLQREASGPFVYEDASRKAQLEPLVQELAGKHVVVHYRERQPWRAYVVVNKPWVLVASQIALLAATLISLFFLYKIFQP